MYVCMIANSETLFDLTNSMTSHIANATPGGKLSIPDDVVTSQMSLPDEGTRSRYISRRKNNI